MLVWATSMSATSMSLAACGSADAQPAKTSGLKPAGWQSLEAAATAARLAAAAPGVSVDGAEAWAQPETGCYALWIALSGGNASGERLRDQIADGLAAEKITAAPDANGFTLEKAPYKGRMTVRADAGQLTALACVSNGRDTTACDASCKQMLGALP
jgi:hypothetical protein